MSETRRPAGPIWGAHALEQEIFAYFDGLCGLEILGASYRRPRLGPVRIDVLDNRRALLRTVVLEGLEDNRPQVVLWHPIARSRGRRYRVRLSAPSLGRQAPVTAWIEIPDPVAHFRLACRLDGELLEGGLKRRLFHSWAGEPPVSFQRRTFEPNVQAAMGDGTVREPELVDRQHKLGRWIENGGLPLEPGDRVLEIGAGLGDLAHEIALRVRSWMGFEPCAAIRRVLARRAAPLVNASVCRHGAIERLPEGPFDLIVWHARTIRARARAIMAMLAQLRTKLASGGLLYVTDLDQGDAISWSRFPAIETREDHVPLRAGVEDPIARRLVRQLECAGFAIERTEWCTQRLAIRCTSAERSSRSSTSTAFTGAGAPPRAE